jgi:hypothetical protein
MPETEPPSPPPDTPPSASGGCAAVALIVIGAVILLPTGLCTAILGAGAVIEMFNSPQNLGADLSDMGVYAFMIAVAAAIGFILIRAGLAMRRRK